MSYLAVYVTVYEHKGMILPGLTREFMRHSAIIVEVDQDNFTVFHVVGTPGIGLTFEKVEGWSNPSTTTARLLAMDFVGYMPADRCVELESILSYVPVQNSFSWNCQDWVRDGLEAMLLYQLVTPEERDRAVWNQRRAIALPFTSDSPNTAALD